MPTWHLEIKDWDADPSAALGTIENSDAKCGAFARAAYRFAADMFGATGAPAAISGGWLPLADGSDSVTITVSAHVGAAAVADGRTYRERVMEELRKGPCE